MTLDDFERYNRGFYGFFGNFRLRDTFQERIVPKPIAIDMDQLCMKFSALNVDFDGSSLDFLGSKNLRTRASKSGTPVKVASKWLGIDWQFEFANRNYYGLSRVS